MVYKHSHFGVYAFVLDEHGQNILLIKKARGPYTGMYDLPGGSPEPDELLEETLHREVREETGCDITEARQLGAVSARFSYQQDGKDALLRHIGVIYQVQITGMPKETGDGEDSHGCRWIKISELNKENATPFVFETLAKTGHLK